MNLRELLFRFLLGLISAAGWVYGYGLDATGRGLRFGESGVWGRTNSNFSFRIELEGRCSDTGVGILTWNCLNSFVNLNNEDRANVFFLL